MRVTLPRIACVQVQRLPCFLQSVVKREKAFIVRVARLHIGVQLHADKPQAAVFFQFDEQIFIRGMNGAEGYKPRVCFYLFGNE